MPIGYVLKRIGVFLLVVWIAASVNFFIPRLAPVNPIREKLLQALSFGGAGKTDMEKVVKAYEEKFGLDKPLWRQYLTYIGDLARFDLGVSIANFPKRVTDVILAAMPWTLILLTLSTVIAVVLGTLAGALLAWPRTPGAFQVFVAPLLTLSAIPYYLLGLILVYVLSFTLKLFPLSGGYTLGSIPSLSWPFIRDALYHSVLPALSIVLASMGTWAISMRGMMISGLGEDYINFAQAKGLTQRQIFFQYALRNALLPQATALALSLGFVVSGAVLVEVVFGYPGIGAVLFRAIQTFDYFVIYGVVFILILSIGLATLIMDLLYPLIDPRIVYQDR
ncbi:ABC transporter permease [Chloroflexi bacterium TSY]|nr:ABC transporter permease [Chloroflexi bacterium TSY]